MIKGQIRKITPITNTSQNTATKATFKTVWVADHSIEHVKAILPTKNIVDKLVN